MKFLYYFLKIDFWVQLILGISIFCSIWFIVGLWLLVPLGAWQVFSGIFLGFGLRDWRRMYYLAGVGTFFSYGFLVDYFQIDDSFSLVFAALSILALAISYFQITKSDHKRFRSDPSMGTWELDDLSKEDLDELPLTNYSKLKNHKLSS